MILMYSELGVGPPIDSLELVTPENLALHACHSSTYTRE